MPHCRDMIASTLVRRSLFLFLSFIGYILTDLLYYMLYRRLLRNTVSQHQRWTAHMLHDIRSLHPFLNSLLPSSLTLPITTLLSKNLWPAQNPVPEKYSLAAWVWDVGDGDTAQRFRGSLCPHEATLWGGPKPTQLEDTHMGERHFNIMSQVLTSAKAQAEWQLVKAAHAAKDAKK